MARLYLLGMDKVDIAIIQLVDGGNGQTRKVTLAEVSVMNARSGNRPTSTDGPLIVTVTR